MPIYLQPIKDHSSLYGFKSVLIAPCPICPAMSTAIRRDKPYIELFHGLLRTGAFHDYVMALKDDLEAHGVRTGVFTSYLPLPLMCLWSEGQRKRLLKRAGDYEAVAVPACDAAAFNVSDAVKSSGCRVLQVMQVKGIVTAVPSLRAPFTLSLKTVAKEGIAWPKLNVEA
jgi:hypothetical protein